jgi:hypothetical protein
MNGRTAGAEHVRIATLILLLENPLTGPIRCVVLSQDLARSPVA